MTRNEWSLRLPLRPEPASPDTVALWADKPTFTRASELAAEYERWAAGRVSIGASELVRELSESVRQLDFLLMSVYQLHHEYWRVAEDGPATAIDQERYLLFVIDVYASAFYYIAHRVQKILQDKHRLLPGIRSYRVAVGVRLVRNHRIEHGDPAKWVSISGYLSNSQLGPRLRANRDADKSGPRGYMFEDARELQEAVVDVLTRAVEQVSGRAAAPNHAT